MTKLGKKFKRFMGVSAAAAAVSMIGVSAVGTTTVMAAPTGTITQAKAKTAALNHAKVSTSKAYDVDIDLERGRRVTYYDVEFKANGYEYDYEIDATNATVIKFSKKALRNTGTNVTGKKTTTTPAKQTSTKVSYIGNSKAKTIALNHAKLTASKVTNLKIELDRENGVVIYDVDFKSGNYSYEYDINAVTGKIIKSQKKAIRNTAAATVKKTTTTASTAKIGTEKAKNIALNHAKLTASKVNRIKVSLDRERGIYVYEVEFKSGNYEYEYEINATTGKIIKFDKEYDR